MIRFGQGGFFSGRGTVPLAGAIQRPAFHRSLSTPPAPTPQSTRAQDASKVLNEALKNLRSAEDNLSILDATMGPEAALQALEEGRESVERARNEYERILAEESA